MLAIRLQRHGRKAYPVYRLAVQESQRHPSSGRVVAYVGSYNPHSKDANIQVELAQNMADVAAHRGQTDYQVISNFLVTQAVRNQAQHLDLAFG